MPVCLEMCLKYCLWPIICNAAACCCCPVEGDCAAASCPVVEGAAQKTAHTVLSSPSLPPSLPPCPPPPSINCWTHSQERKAKRHEDKSWPRTVTLLKAPLPLNLLSSTTIVRNKRRKNWFALQQQPLQG